MAKSKDPKDMTPEELAMYNEILDLERQSKEKELQAIEKKKQKELKKLDKAQAKINGIPFEDEKSKIKKVEEPVEETVIEEIQQQPTVNNTTNNVPNKDDDVTFNNSLKSFLKDIDPIKKKRRYEVLIENLYKFAAGGSKEAIRAIITMVERIEGRPGISNNNNDDEKEDTIANEIHALTQAIKSKELKEDKDEC